MQTRSKFSLKEHFWFKCILTNDQGKNILPCSALPWSNPPWGRTGHNTKKNFRPALTCRSGQGVRASGQPCPVTVSDLHQTKQVILILSNFFMVEKNATFHLLERLIMQRDAVTEVLQLFVGKALSPGWNHPIGSEKIQRYPTVGECRIFSNLMGWFRPGNCFVRSLCIISFLLSKTWIFLRDKS
jgi:hypothetical protein